MKRNISTYFAAAHEAALITFLSNSSFSTACSISSFFIRCARFRSSLSLKLFWLLRTAKGQQKHEIQFWWEMRFRRKTDLCIAYEFERFSYKDSFFDQSNLSAVHINNFQCQSHEKDQPFSNGTKDGKKMPLTSVALNCNWPCWCFSSKIRRSCRYSSMILDIKAMFTNCQKIRTSSKCDLNEILEKEGGRSSKQDDRLSILPSFFTI